MAKHRLVTTPLWDTYSEKVKARMNNPVHKGELDEADAERLGGRLIVADWGAEACGDAIRLYWVVDPKTSRVIAAKFRSFGCGTAIAASDVMTELTIGKTVDEALEVTNLDVEKTLRDKEDRAAFPPQKMHCSVLAYDVIKQAVAIYQGVDVATLEDSQIVCECARVSLSTIKEAIEINNLKTIEDVTNYTKAGGYCKSCIKPGGHEKRAFYLETILADTMKTKVKRSLRNDIDFLDLTPVRQLLAIEDLLDKKIRPVLTRDGGNVKILDLRQQGNGIDLYMEYQGACQSCPSGKTETLYFIEKTLKENLTEQINVIL